MINFNNVKLIYKNPPTLSYFVMFTYFTLGLLVNLVLYLGFDNGNILLITNGLLLIVYFLSGLFIKNTLLVLFKEWLSLFLLFVCLIFLYFNFGLIFFESWFVYSLFGVYFLFDFYYIFSRNGGGISKLIYDSFDGDKFCYEKREEYRIEKFPLKRSIVHKFFYSLTIIFFILMLIFGKNIPYVFFGVNKILKEGHYFGYEIVLFFISIVSVFIFSTFVNTFFLFVFYFIKGCMNFNRKFNI